MEAETRILLIFSFIRSLFDRQQADEGLETALFRMLQF